MENSRFFPDGSAMDPWFSEIPKVTLDALGRPYRFDEWGIPGDGTLQTAAIQTLIDRAAAEGGGVIVVTEGTYLSGALHFRQGVHLYLCAGATLIGSDDIRDFPLCETRIEGQNCLYFPALINAEGLDGFTIAGEGVIDGNGLRYWQDFWLRRAWNPQCTNKDTQRPRLVYIARCENVLVTGVTLQNAPFWTNHLYKCRRVKYVGCRILSPHEPVGAPSSDAIDIDACTDVLVKGCTMAVNDDAVALKGGKGAWADEQPENGANENILIEDCVYGFCHGCLTFGSENIHTRNVVFRNIEVGTGYNLLWMKLRPDTPQRYEHVLVENIRGKAANFININPWSQFYDRQGREDMPISACEHVTVRNCRFECDTFFNVRADEAHYHLKDFALEDLDIVAANADLRPEAVENLRAERVRITPKQTIDFPDSVTTLTDDNTVIS
ncbi:MAG: glycosyl hydrolase family 28 protein [Clostridia bacterium]|nr:glycosyl hydrolase family 28 protein [Clostridia bacterium]